MTPEDDKPTPRVEKVLAPQCRKPRLAAHSLCLENREKPSRWGQLAREGHRIVQFRDVRTLFSSRAFSLRMTLQLQLVKGRLLN